MQIADLIERAARHFGGRPAFVHGDASVTFEEFDRRTNQVANGLLQQGLMPGDRVAVALPNSIEQVLTFYGLAKAGLVRVPINTKDVLADVHYKLADSQVRGVVAASAAAFDVDVHVSSADFGAVFDSASDAPCRDPRGGEAPLRFAYTGGTTGKPKAVQLSTVTELRLLTNLLADLVPGLGPDDAMLHSAPLTHGSGGFVLPHLVKGARSVILDRFDPPAWISSAIHHRISTTFVVPTMLARLVDEANSAELSATMRYLVYSGSPIAPSLLARCLETFGPVLTQTYGQSEAPLALTYLGPHDHDRLNSAGRPYTTVDVEIHDPAGNALGPGEVGEVVTRGEHTMSGYWDRPDATREALGPHGWLRTGDIGQWDERGFLYLLDRKNDLIISGGYNVYPREVEDVLTSHPSVKDAVAFGLPDPVWGEVVSAAVVLREPMELTSLTSYCRDRMSTYKIPRHLEEWAQLPQSAVGKSLRREVKDAVLSRGIAHEASN